MAKKKTSHDRVVHDDDGFEIGILGDGDNSLASRISRVVERMGSDLTWAQEGFKEEFGYAHDDPRVYEDLAELLPLISRANPKLALDVLLPLTLACALSPLRGREGRPNMVREKVRRQALAVAMAEWRWAELVQKGEGSKRAKHIAATESHGAIYGGEHTVGALSTFKGKMNLDRGRAALAKGVFELPQQ